MNNKELKANAIVGVGAPDDPHFGEHTQTSPKAYTNPKSKIKTLTSDHKGITLIALVITIIVMLILVAVTVTVAINGGLFTTAKQAKADTQANIDAEQRLASGRIKVDGKWYDSLEDYTKGIESSDQNDGPSKWAQDAEGNITYDGKPSEINIGDYVNYKPDEKTYSKEKLTKDYTGNTDSDYNNSDLTTDTDLKWRVLGVDTKGCLTLISDKQTTKGVTFYGAKGYNNGVYILNDICKTLYSNKNLGVTARSITIEDIEEGFSEAGKTARDNYNKDSSSKVQYGKTNETPYSSNKTYPVIYKYEEGSEIDGEKAGEDAIGGSDPYYEEAQLTSKSENKESDTADSNLTCTQTYYEFSSTPEKYCKNEKFYELIFGTNSMYWLASRYVHCDPGFAGFGFRYVSWTELSGDGLFYSDDGPNDDYYGHFLRPVVSLGSNITIQAVENNSETNPHKIPGLE